MATAEVAPSRTCEKVSRIKDVRVELSAPDHCYRGLRIYGESERGWRCVAESLNDWVKELKDFYRDHRSQDEVGFEVVTDRIDACSVCGAEWEPCTDDSQPYCAHCGAEIGD